MSYNGIIINNYLDFDICALNLYVFGFTLIGLIITEIPSTNAILAIFEPMTFPMAISATLSKAA